MRVLMINENIGGHASVHATLRRVLAEEHPDVEVEMLDVPAAGLTRRALGMSVPGLGRLDADLQSLRAQLALSSLVRREVRRRAGSFDVLHVYTGNAALRIPDVLAAVPSVITTDATNVTNAYRLPYRVPTRFTPWTVRRAQRFEKPAYEAATLVVANTEWVARSLRDDYGIVETLRVFPFGIEAPTFQPGPAPGAADGRAGGPLPRIVFVGRGLDRKGGLRLHRLHQEHLADLCELVLVTTDTVPAGRNVVAVDDVTVGSGRLWEVLRDAAVFAFPSTIDQAPNAVIEAFAAGLPVVALDIAAMPEMVPPTVGRLVPADDDEALVATLRELVSDRRLRAGLGAAARAHFLTRYDARAATSRLVETLREAQARHRARSR